MVVGMMVLGGLFNLGLAAAGTGFDAVQNEAPVVTALVMAFNMALPMAVWMSYRGHSSSRSIEMGAAMFAPGLLAVALMELALIKAGAVCSVECGVMIPVMVGLMLYRWKDYASVGGTEPGAQADLRRARC